MKQTAFFGVLLVFASADAMQTRHTSTCAEFNKQGIICSANCKVVQYCMQSDRGWDTIILETCAGTSTCDSSEGTCSEKTTCTVKTPFPCTGAGRFPDPFDCQRFHDCEAYNKPSVVKECEKNLAFNFRDNLCSLDTDDVSCNSRQFTCSRNGQMGNWGSEDKSHNLYYICVSSGNAADPYKPVLYRCSGKQIFNGTKCVDP